MTILLTLALTAWTTGDLAGAPEAHAVKPVSWTVADLAGPPSQAVREVAKSAPVAQAERPKPLPGSVWPKLNGSNSLVKWNPPTPPQPTQYERRWHDIVEYPAWQAYGYIDSGGLITPEGWRQKIVVAAPAPQQPYRWAMPMQCGAGGCR